MVVRCTNEWINESARFCFRTEIRFNDKYGPMFMRTYEYSTWNVGHGTRMKIISFEIDRCMKKGIFYGHSESTLKRYNAASLEFHTGANGRSFFRWSRDSLILWFISSIIDPIQVVAFLWKNTYLLDWWHSQIIFGKSNKTRRTIEMLKLMENVH